jgi:hypothetical protein
MEDVMGVFMFGYWTGQAVYGFLMAMLLVGVLLFDRCGCPRCRKK